MPNKTYELTFKYNGMVISEYYEGANATHAKAICRQRYKGKLGKIDVKEICEAS